MTTVASGFCTSAPAPVLKAMGTKPSAATRAVMSTGRRRMTLPWTIASSTGSPASCFSRMKVTITSPLSTATPESAMKPTAAEIENGMPRSQRATTPPVSASGTQTKTIAACFASPKVAYSRPKISRKQIGTTTMSRARARSRFSKVPPQER